MNIIQALDDPQVFGPFFRGPTWDVWRVFLAALFGLPLTPEQLALYTKHTGRSTPPTQPLHEAWLVCGRRAGKSFILACIAIFLACFQRLASVSWPRVRVGTVMIIAADRRQARVIMRYCLGLLEVGADAGAADRERDARERHTAQSHRRSRFTPQVFGRREATPSLLRCSTRSRTGPPTRPAPSPMSR